MTQHPLFSVQDEVSPLRDVIIGRSAGFHRDPASVEVVNSTQQKTVDAGGHPDPGRLDQEFGAFKAALEAESVQVHIPDLSPESVQDQTCPRDIGFVIDDTLVQAGMRHASRQDEFLAIEGILSGFSGPRLCVPDGVALEGGDVIVERGAVYVGIGQRSDWEGADWLQSRFGGNHKIVPVQTRPEEVLHLDCTFNPLGLGHALVYPAGILEMPASITEAYEWIEVDRGEMQELATNVFSLAPDTVVARRAPGCARVNSVLRQAGYRVIELDFDAVPGIGGSFRCATLPLLRS